MNVIHEIHRRLRRFNATLAVVDSSIEAMVMVTADLKVATNHLVAFMKQAASPRPDPTFIYVLPPTGPMMAREERVPLGSQRQVTFEPYLPLPAETWIVAVGPATTYAVKVGNQSQCAMADYQGHVCQLKDGVPLGHRITVELRG